MKQILSSRLILFNCDSLHLPNPQMKTRYGAELEALTKAIFETKDSIALLDLVSTKVTYGHSVGNIEDKATMVAESGGKQTDL